MAGLLAKLILCPVTILASDMLFGNINYGSVYQDLIVGAIIAVVGHTMELIILRRGTLWISNAMDFIAAAVIVYVSQFYLPGSSVSAFGAILVALLLLITENVQHLYLIRGDRVEK
jgi:hypothetical protein